MTTHKTISTMTVEHIQETLSIAHACSDNPHEAIWANVTVQFLLDVIKEKDAVIADQQEQIRKLSTGESFGHY